MATISSEQQRIMIPAAYLDDALTAVANEIRDDADLISNDPVERAHQNEIISRDVRLREHLLAADGDVTITAETDSVSSPIEHMLDEIVRIVASRLRTAATYAPVPMGAVAEMAEELRWAAAEAIRLEPSRGDRTEA